MNFGFQTEESSTVSWATGEACGCTEERLVSPASLLDWVVKDLADLGLGPRRAIGRSDVQGSS